MDTKLVTTNVRLSKWNAIIQDRIQSGLTVDAYCADKGIARNKYYYWLHKIKASAIEACPGTFAELLPQKCTFEQETNSAFSPQMIIRTNDLAIEVNSDTPRQLLCLVLEVIKNAQ